MNVELMWISDRVYHTGMYGLKWLDKVFLNAAEDLHACGEVLSIWSSIVISES